MTTAGSIEGLVRPDAVHRQIYKRADVFEMEMERIFKGTWVFVGHESDVRAPGDFRTMRIGREPIILCRDRDGVVRVLVNRCRHRGATVCQLAAGNTNMFRCQYHGWTYADTGELLAIPYPERYDNDIRPDLGLVPVARVEAYRGLVFASFNPAVPSLVEHLGPDACGYIDVWMDHCGGRPFVTAGQAHQVIVSSNWKFQTENGLDGYHGGFTHRSFFNLMQRRTGANVRFANNLPTAQTKAFRHGHAAVDPETTSKKPLHARIAVLPGADAMLAAMRAAVGDAAYEELLDGLPGPGINIGIFPNLQLIGVHVRRIDPVSVDHTVVSVTPLLLEDAPPEFNDLRLRYHELFYGPAGFGQPDDLEMFARVHDGIDDTEDPWLLLDRGITREEVRGEVRVGNVTDDTPMRAQYREWVRLMGEVPVHG